jgi:hypothetical protein
VKPDPLVHEPLRRAGRSSGRGAGSRRAARAPSGRPTSRSAPAAAGAASAAPRPGARRPGSGRSRAGGSCEMPRHREGARAGQRAGCWASTSLAITYSWTRPRKSIAPDLRPPTVALARSGAPKRTARVPDAVADGVGRNFGRERGDREEIRLEQPCGDAVDDVSVDRRAARLNRPRHARTRRPRHEPGFRLR